MLDAICGHAPRTVGEGYGGVTLRAKMRAMEMFPIYRANYAWIVVTIMVVSMGDRRHHAGAAQSVA